VTTAARRSVTVPEAMRVAIGAHQRGDVAAAEDIYRQVLAAVPDHPNAAGLLGLALVQTGRGTEAEPLIRAALRADALNPVHHHTLGTLLRNARRLDEAIGAYREAVRLGPQLADAHVALGMALREAGHPDEARATLERALALEPRNALAHLHMGLVRSDLGDAHGALDCVRRSCELAPGLADAHINRAALLGELLLHDEALEAARKAVALAPDRIEAHVNLGSALAAQGDFLAAIERFRRALVADPLDARLVSDIAGCLYGLGRGREAAAMFERALALDPLSPETHSLCVFSRNYYEEDPQALLDAHRGYRASLGTVSPSPPIVAPAAAGRRVRLGYVSPDFRRHSVAAFLAPLLVHRDRARFEVVCFHVHPARDGVTARLRALADEWFDAAPLSQDALADCIRAAGIDVLVDLAGHTAGSRLPAFARRPAPMQMTYLGYPTTTGLDEIDYRITDAVVDPPGEAPLASERPLRLPGSYFCFEPGDAPAPAPLPALRDGRITFGSFNVLAKLSDATVSMWAGVLARVPGSRLVLKSRGLAVAATQDEIRARFAAHGIAPARIECRGWLADQADHRAAYAEIDIALDSFPYNGATTTCEALWMGVPVVTRHGATHASRMGRSILTACGLDAYAVGSGEAFVDAAARLAADTAALAALRGGLRARVAASALCDAPTFMRGFEDALLHAWRERIEAS
jgi:predicted O-linked N-acetylglucosamine transferase (SPINDLY family)